MFIDSYITAQFVPYHLWNYNILNFFMLCKHIPKVCNFLLQGYLKKIRKKVCKIPKRNFFQTFCVKLFANLMNNKNYIHNLLNKYIKKKNIFLPKNWKVSEIVLICFKSFFLILEHLQATWWFWGNGKKWAFTILRQLQQLTLMILFDLNQKLTKIT